jgi:hypothetical protein
VALESLPIFGRKKLTLTTFLKVGKITLTDSILFPANEIEDLNIRLTSKKPIYTIRVSKEYGKYKLGKIYRTNLKYSVKVVESKTLKDIEDYEFYDELSIEVLEELGRYNKFNVLKLVGV